MEIKTHVLVAVDTLERLKDQALWLECLELAGVDNWGGCDYAGDLYERIKNGKEPL
jgi:hypothetical protein